MCSVVEEQQAEKLRQREARREERHARYLAKRDRKLEDDPAASEPSSVSNSTFTISDEDTGWLSTQAEVVLEPYFMSFDNTWNRLQARRRRCRPCCCGMPSAGLCLVLRALSCFQVVTPRACRGSHVQGACTHMHASAALCCLCNAELERCCSIAHKAEAALKPRHNHTYQYCCRMQAVGEFIDDTEDYVNITLDSHRNQLIQVDLFMNAATFCVSMVTFITGIFGMNLMSGIEESPVAFDLVWALSLALALSILVMFILFMRHKRLAFV